MNNKLVEIIEQSGLPQNKIQDLMSNFSTDFSEAQKVAQGAMEIVVTDESQTELMDSAREKRLALKNIRVNTEKTRKELKEQSLREGKAIDGAANIIKALIVPIEEHLEKQEKFAELLQEKREAEKIQQRTEELSKYVEDVSLYDIKNLSTETYTKLLESAKKSFNDKIEAEKKVEEERIAREKANLEEQKIIKAENEKLRLEAEKNEKELQREREARELAERKVQEEKAIAERMKREEEEKVAKQKAEEEEKQRQAQLAPDKEKMRAFYKKLTDLKTELGIIEFADEKTQIAANEIYTDLGIVLAKIVIKMKTL